MNKTGYATIPIEMYAKLKADSDELSCIKGCKLAIENIYGRNMVIRPDIEFTEYIDNLLKTKFEEQFGGKGIEYDGISEYNLRVAQFVKEDGSDDEA